MNGYHRDIFSNHVEKYLSENIMTTNSCQNINDEKKYTVIIPSMTFKKSLSKNLKSLSKKCCTIFKTFKVQNYLLWKMTLHWPHKQMSFIFLKVHVIRTKPILVKQKDSWQLGLGSNHQEIQPFFTYILLHTCSHSTIENFDILSHGINDFDNRVKEALYIKKQKPLLNKHLRQHGASFLLNVFQS